MTCPGRWWGHWSQWVERGQEDVPREGIPGLEPGWDNRCQQGISVVCVWLQERDCVWVELLCDCVRVCAHVTLCEAVCACVAVCGCMCVCVPRPGQTPSPSSQKAGGRQAVWGRLPAAGGGNAAEKARKQRLHPLPGILEGPVAPHPDLLGQLAGQGCRASPWRPRPQLPRQRPRQPRLPAASGRCAFGQADPVRPADKGWPPTPPYPQPRGSP